MSKPVQLGRKRFIAFHNLLAYALSMTGITKDEQGLGVVEMMLVFVITALIVVVGWFLYNDDHKKPLSTTLSTSKTSTTPSTSVFKVPQLGVEFTVPIVIKDIVYTVDPSRTLSTGQKVQSVTLSTETLTKLAADCSDTGSAPPLGTISKTTGKYPTKPDIDLNNASGALIKQFPTYYIAWNSPQAGCGSTMSVSTKALAETNLFSPSLKTVQPLP